MPTPEGKTLKAACQQVEDQEDEHLYHSMGWSRELWIDSLGLSAVLPPPEEEMNVERRLRLLELRSLGNRWCRETRSLQHHGKREASRGPQPENSHLTNEEMSPQILSTAFLILCALVLYQLALIFAPFFTPILWALILARLFYPLYRHLLRLLRGQATLSAFLSHLAVTFVAVLPVYVAFLAITETIHVIRRQ